MCPERIAANRDTHSINVKIQIAYTSDDQLEAFIGRPREPMINMGSWTSPDTQYMAAVSDGELRSGVGSLVEQQDESSAALDMLFLGF